MSAGGRVGVASASASMTIAGRYRLIEVVGTGPMGRIWRAHDELLDQEVALKEFDRTAVARSRAEQEAREAAGFDDPGLVRIIDVVRTTGRSWIVMEYVRSRSLYDRVTQDGPLTHREAARVGLGILRTLETTHAAGVLHKSVEPRHVLIADDGRIVLTDLGVASVAAARPAVGTQPLFGPRHYVAPEIRAGRFPSEAADLWSVGATLYTAVERFPPLSQDGELLLNPGPLQHVITGLLTTDPAGRTTIGPARAALQVVVDRVIGVSAVPAPPPSPAPAEEVPFVPPARGRRRLRRTGFAAGALAMISVAAIATPSIRAHARLDWAALTSPTAGSNGSTAAAVSTGACAGATAQAVTDAEVAPVALPAGWRWHVDPAGFNLPVPAGWSRAAINGTVCFSAPGGTSVFAVDPELLNDDGPLLHWQATEISALAAGTLPGYQRVAMESLPGGGADWEYTWQPVTGPRLHTRQVLPTAEAGTADGLSWTAPDADWAAGVDEQQILVAGFRDPSNSAS